VSSNVTYRLMNLYQAMYNANGYLDWWPGDTELEICIGAILTQNTAWNNVEKAISNLKREGMLDVERILSSSTDEIANLIRPSGYFNQKALYLIEFCKFLQDNQLDSLKVMEAQDVRGRLLNVKGIGKETADSIMLYALGFPIFVVDAYTKRLLSRVGLTSNNASYDDIQDLFMENLVTDIELFNDYHAQIVEIGKNYCRKHPKCDLCPIRINGLCTWSINKSSRKS